MRARVLAQHLRIDPVPPDMIARIKQESAAAVRLHNRYVPDEPYVPPLYIDYRVPFTVVPILRKRA